MIQFELSQTRPRNCSAAVMIVGVYEERMLASACAEVDEASGGHIKALLDSGDLSGKLGSTQMLHRLAGLQSPRVLVVGLGEERKFDVARYQRVLKEAFRALRTLPGQDAHCYLCEIDVAQRDLDWKITQATLIADYHLYRYQATLKPKKEPEGKLARVLWAAPSTAAGALTRAVAIAAGVTLARELGNLPPNICNPAYLAEQGRALAARYDSIETTVIEKAEMESMGMGSLLAVARGSANAPKLVVMHHRGADESSKPYVFVGKGITFDTGGINIKPSAGMEEMKFDMCGAASVFGLMETIGRLNPKQNIIGITPAVENMPGGDAYRPSDVLTTMSGHTVEVLNTDAEGRLILCDALTYALRFTPHTLIDIATLTGACVVALGTHATGLMSKHDDLASDLLTAGDYIHDRAWRLPLWDEYQQQLETGYADFANIGGKYGGAITAGCFLQRFVENVRWAHLDIAGTAWDAGRKGTATGRPVAMLVEWLGRQG